MQKGPNSGVIRLQIGDFKGFKENEEVYEEECIGKNDWTLSVYHHIDKTENEKYMGVYLKCNDDLASNVWFCNASVRFSLINSDDKDNAFSINFMKKFSRNDKKLDVPTFKKWKDVTKLSNHFVVKNKAVIKCFIEVHNSHGINKVVWETFDEPKEHLTDVVLLVEGKKLHVGKQVLAMHSRYFHTLFFSNFKESTETEIPIEDVVHVEFVDLLNLIYPSHRLIDKKNVKHILKLADRFEFWSVIEKAEDFLIETEEVDIVDKLKYGETYKLPYVQATCCQELQTIEDVFDLMNHERYHELGDVTLSLLFQRLAEIKKA